ncbi:metallophosphoesterase family protein [Novosphingobium aquimarinum]|uniref:metallophosphoesterase family protein n=1 Tax=Novosphingobium aquimarinum TaxID=2682494 RepID=UPI0012EC1B65|nr:metallophosphoesterase family protein [Novosphingobium aquimarinum]
MQINLPFLKRRKPAAPEAGRRSPTVPDGERVYAIGDVHGCADELATLLDMITKDHEARGPAKLTVIFLGDLVNRGPDSARAVRLVRDLLASGTGRLIKGNHEEIFVSAARGHRQAVRTLLRNGGRATLTSFGIAEDDIDRGSYGDLSEILKRDIPREDISLLDAGEDKIAIGDYLFVHAGVRPGISIAHQESSDLRWIREEFVESDKDHGALIVHGHTICESVDRRRNRIGIDTGAYRSGVLTAIGLESDQQWFLATTPDRSSGHSDPELACSADSLGAV